MSGNGNITQSEEKTIDASGRPLGRVATEVATVLRGKDSTSFVYHQIRGARVQVINASKMRIPSVRKLEQKTYIRYSGYPGGQKEETLQKLVARLGYGEAVRRAVRGMLPNNKLRSKLMNRLSVSE